MIRVNDKWDVPWREGMSLVDVMAACGFSHRHVVVSINSRAVPPAEIDDHPVADGDRVQVTHIIGGG
jgi:thiamine biosynthesis protein ThiS